MKKEISLAVACMVPGIAGLANNAKKQTENTDTRPNILFIIADDASYQHFGAYGCSWVHTPGFDSVAQQGLLFSNCYTPNAKSAPSRTTLLTGLYSWQSGAAANHNPYFPPDIKVVTEALSDNGYTVAYTGKGWAPGNTGTIDGKKRELTGTPYLDKKVTPPTKGIHDVDYAGNFRDFLDDAQSGKPWFFWFGCFEPHREYEFGSGERLAEKKKTDINKLPVFWPDNDIVRTDMLDYGYEIEYFDKQIQAYLNELEKRNMLDNTIIFITSDNGMPFPRCKGNNYEYSNHMPLAVMWKNGIKKPGRKITDYVSFIDLTPTFLELSKTGVKESEMIAPSGKSLTDIFYSRKDGQVTSYRNYVVLGRERHDYGRPRNQGYPIRSIIKDNLLYINNLKPELLPAGNPETGYADCDGSPTKTEILTMQRNGTNMWYYNLNFGLRSAEELYDLSTDEDCIINLAYKPEFARKKLQLKAFLYEELKKQNDPRLEGKGEIFDQYPYSEPIGVDFWENVMNGTITNPWEITKGWLNFTDYDTYE